MERTLKGVWLYKRDCKHVVIVKWTDLRRRLLRWKGGRQARMAGQKHREVSRGTRCDAGQVVLKGDLFKMQILILYVWRGP